MRMHGRFSCLITIGLALFTGCSQGPYDGKPRIPLRGKVTYDGKPIDGLISFIPKEESNRLSGGTVEAGNYSVPEAQGANAGTYRVEVHSLQLNGNLYKDPDTLEMRPELEESLPEKYNRRSDLTVEVSETQNQFDFDLTK